MQDDIEKEAFESYKQWLDSFTRKATAQQSYIEGYRAHAARSGWVLVSEIESHFDFTKIEPYDIGPCVAMSRGDGEWEMVRLTRQADIDEEGEPDIPAIFTYGAYVDSEFIKDTDFTYFMKITPPQLKGGE